MTVHMKAIEQYFHVVLFIMPYKVVLTFKSVDETLGYDHSYKSLIFVRYKPRVQQQMLGPVLALHHA